MLDKKYPKLQNYIRLITDNILLVYKFTDIYWYIYISFTKWVTSWRQWHETKAARERVSRQIALRKTSPPRHVAAISPFYFPEISQMDSYIEPAGQKDDRSDRRRAYSIAPELARECVTKRRGGASERTRKNALSLIFSDWLAGLPIWPITGKLRGTANRNYMVGATPKFARDGNYVYISPSFHLSLSTSSHSLSLSSRRLLLLLNPMFFSLSDKSCCIRQIFCRFKLTDFRDLFIAPENFEID